MRYVALASDHDGTLASNGTVHSEKLLAIVSILGAITTVFLLPETKGKSLEELSAEDETPVERVAA